MTSDAALLAGLQSQRELLAGWLTLLTSPDDLPATWGLPRVAGVWVEGPPGCGRPELVRAAADDVPVPLHDVALDRIFKPERLLDVLQGALAKAGDRGVILVDRVELLTGDDALSNYRTQFGAVFRWFLDSVAERRGLAVVLGASSLGTVDPGLATNPLLPRSLSIPPPDMERRKLLFEAALADVPVTDVDTPPWRLARPGSRQRYRGGRHARPVLPALWHADDRRHPRSRPGDDTVLGSTSTARCLPRVRPGRRSGRGEYGSPRR